MAGMGLLRAEPVHASPQPELLIVTATRAPTPLDDVLAPAIVISRDDLARSLAIDVTDVLRFHAGLDIGRNGGPGQPTSVFIRGAESNHTLVLVDGVRINPGTIGAAQLQNIAPELVERIEIIKGPRSALYGTDAIGGVINVITRRPADDYLELQAGAGAYDTMQGSLAGGASGTRGELAFGASWIDSAGFPTRTEDDVDRGFDNLSATVRAQTRLGGLDLALRHWRAEGTSEYSDFLLTPVDQDFRNATTALVLAGALGSRWSSSFVLSLMQDEIVQNDSPDRLQTERWGFDWQNDIELAEAHTLTLGLLRTAEDAESQSFGLGFDETTDVTNVFAQDRGEVGRHAWVVSAGYTDHETFGGQRTGNVEYGIALGAATRLVIAAGSAFRAPDATDRYGFGGNPELEPEESVAGEISLRHHIGQRQTVTLSAFRNDIDNLIEFVVVDFDTFEGELRNVEHARIEGVEASYEVSGEDWRVRAEASYQDPVNRSTGARLLRRARETLTLSGVRSFGRLELGIDALAASDRKDFGFPEPVTLDSYLLVNLTARYALTPRLTLMARVENALDEDYELASGYNTPDRGVFVALRYAPQ